MSAPTGTHLWLVLMKAHRALARHAVRSVEAAALCFSDFAVLELLLHRGPQPVNVIGRRIELTSGAITTAVDRLEGRGLVERSASADDRRARIVSLTPAGQALITEVYARHAAAMEQAVSGLDPEQRAALIHLLKTLGLAAQRQLTDPEDPDA